LEHRSEDLIELKKEGIIGGELLEQGKEVYSDPNAPFETPADKFVQGPYYVDPDEVDANFKEDDQGAQKPPKLAVDRRDFMRLFSASSVFAATACVKRPLERAIPHVNQPNDQILGTPTYYATTCGECSAGCGVMVKTREGRPVKIEGNPESPISQGATCALGQSTLQALYHPERRKAPSVKVAGRMIDASWNEWIESLSSKLGSAKNIGIFTGGSTGHRQKFFKEVLRKLGMPESNLYTHESNSLYAAVSEAHRIAFGQEMLPRAELRKTDLILGIGSDFLEIGTSPVYSSRSFAESHSFKNGKMGRFVQIESALSQTGARANERHVIPAGYEVYVALLMARHLLDLPGARGSTAEKQEIKKSIEIYADDLNRMYDVLQLDREFFKAIAQELLKSSSVVLAGSSFNFDENSTALQLAAVMVNTLIGAYGETLFIDRGWMTAPVKANDTKRFFDEASKLDALIVIDSNPAFTFPTAWDFVGAVKHIPVIASIQSMPNETDRVATHVGNGHHYLESWGDEQPVAGFWSARQPAVRPAFESRQAEDVLLWVAAALKKPLGYREYRDYLKVQWRSTHKLLAAKIDFDTFFDAILRRGFGGRLARQSVSSLKGIAAVFKLVEPSAAATTLVSNLDVRLRDGVGASRPVLQEVGDSLTTIAWDSWVAMNPNRASQEGVKKHDVVKVTGPNGSFEAAVYLLPGLHPSTIVVPRGNGHPTGVSKVTDNVGVNPLTIYAKRTDSISGQPVTSVQPVTIEKTGRRYQLASMQKHNDIANRKEIITKKSLASAAKDLSKKKDLDTVPDLYPVLDKGAEYRWGMSIDLTSCTGCSACMVACATENNIPSIGREQIIRGREMHWIRLDRYFSGDLDNPEVTIQPVMCQHCNHAPCEAVCPVYATTHDPEGLNSQTYNRCVGTRYCANACPYKVRRFNWFTHKWNMIGDLPMDRNPRALNPDVTVRTRGVMEKCTFCFQRIRDAKHTAKERGTKVSDNTLQTACQQVCPSGAIVFGDLKNPRSMAAKLRRDNRAYLLLGGDPDHKHYGIKTLPNVSYLAKITHQETEAQSHDPHHG
jgi:Fe-S-cluster-containing dehydrogenase component/anaerobic selenocysteine-containing dehydrogenase